MNTGSSYYFATEIDINLISAVAAMFYRARPQYPTSENSIRYKLEVETVPQTGSTNNLTTETDIVEFIFPTVMQ